MAASEEHKSCTRENGVYYFEQINELFNSRRKIEEFDIIPSVEPNYKSCPFVVEESKVGIFSWCVKDLLCYAYNELIGVGKCPCVEMENKGAYLMNLSRIVLLVHSEDYTIWNLRKHITSIEKYAKDELDFCTLVLRKHPRSAETFSHRRWLLNLLYKRNEQDLASQQFLQQELDICLQCANRYRDNYIAWDQRCWLIDNLKFKNGICLEEELNCTKDWLWTHVSDNSVYHFRQQVLKKLGSSCSLKKMKELLLEEFTLTDEILEHYPAFETVWYHRRFLISFWCSTFHPCQHCLEAWRNKEKRCSEDKNNSKGTIFKDLKDEYNIQYECCEVCQKIDKIENTISIHSEVNLCRRILLQTREIKYPETTRHVHLAASHLRWIGYFCKKLLERT